MAENVVRRAFRAYRRGGAKRLYHRAVEHGERHGANIELINTVASRRTVQKLRQRQKTENDLDDVLATVGTLDQAPMFRGTWPFYSFVAKQNCAELKALARRVERVDPNYIVEVGSARGGSLYIWARHFDANIVASVDVDHRGRETVFRQFDPDTEVVPIQGYSHDSGTVSEVSSSISGQPIDFVYIDASHEYEDVKADFEAYSNLVADGGAIGFHDVDGTWEGVTKFWDEIQSEYETERVGAKGGNGIVYL